MILICNDVVPCGGRKMSPRTLTILIISYIKFIFFF